MSEHNPTFLTWPKILLASVLLPPLGIVMCWFRPWKGGWTRRTLAALGRLLLSGVVGVLAIVYLVRLDILHMEQSGAGWRPIFSFHDPKDDLLALEQHRAAQREAYVPSETPEPTSSSLPTNPSEKETASVVEHSVPVPEPIAESSAAPPVPSAWTDFRGPQRDGIYTPATTLAPWPKEGLKPLWRQPCGGGYASFVVFGGKAYTIEQRGDREVVAAYEVDTGRELWTDGWEALFSESMGGDGPRATPTWHEGRLYALGATGEFRCYDATSGQVLWAKNILVENNAQNIAWGMANSPLIVDATVIVTPGGPGRSVVAYDKVTGDFVWGALDDKAAYTSPVTVTLAGQRQLVVVTARRIVGLTADGGRLLWEYPWTTMYDINVAQPIVTVANHLFVSAGYDHGSVLLEISEDNATFSARAVWENRNMKNRFSSSVLHQGFIYGFDESIFACIDARTGERRWKGGRYGYGQVLLAGNHLIVLTESGDLVLVEPSPDAHREVARMPAIEGKTWNVPAIDNGILLVRNAREMAAFRLTP